MHALEKEMATHPSVLAWRIPGTREPGGLLSIGSHRVGYNWTDLAAAAANYRVLICWTCQFQSSSLFFVVLASSVSKSLQYLTSTLTQGGKGGHLFRVTCSIVLWGGRNTAHKYHWHMWGVLAVSGPHWVCPRSRRVCFPGLHCSSSRLLCRGTVSSGPWVA